MSACASSQNKRMCGKLQWGIFTAGICAQIGTKFRGHIEPYSENRSRIFAVFFDLQGREKYAKQVGSRSVRSTSSITLSNLTRSQPNFEGVCT